MRPEHHGNTHPRLLRNTALGDTVAAIPKRRTKPETGNEPRNLGVPANTPGGAQDTVRVRRTEKAPTKVGQPASSAEAPVPVSSSKVSDARKEQRTDAGKPSTTRKGRSRFIGPTHLDDAHKARIVEALKSHGIGDEIGREIFVGALEYQLSAFGDQLRRRGEPAPSAAVEPDSAPKRPPPAVPDEALRTIGKQTRLLAEQLRALSEPAGAELTLMIAALDRLGRGYDEHYLREFACEVERLEQACACMTELEPESPPEPEPARPAEDPAPNRDLVAKLASVFSECFEQQPTAEADGQFQALLAVLEEETGYLIGRDSEFLGRILGRA